MRLSKQKPPSRLFKNVSITEWKSLIEDLEMLRRLFPDNTDDEILAKMLADCRLHSAYGISREERLKRPISDLYRKDKRKNPPDDDDEDDDTEETKH